MPNAKVCIDNKVIAGNGAFGDYLAHIEEALKHLFKAGLQVSAEKCKWAAYELTFLGFNLAQDSFEPGLAKVEASLSMAPLQNTKQLKRFLGRINFY